MNQWMGKIMYHINLRSAPASLEPQDVMGCERIPRLCIPSFCCCLRNCRHSMKPCPILAASQWIAEIAVSLNKSKMKLKRERIETPNVPNSCLSISRSLWNMLRKMALPTRVSSHSTLRHIRGKVITSIFYSLCVWVCCAVLLRQWREKHQN